MKKYLIIPVLALMFGIGVMAATISFPDVKSTDWFYKDVMNMVDWGVIKGNDDGTFKPQNNVNRAELSAMWNRYDDRVLNLMAGVNEKLTLVEYKVDAIEAWNTVKIVYDGASANPDTYCPNLKNSNSMFTLAGTSINVLKYLYEPAENSIPYIKTDLAALENTMIEIEALCK